MRKDNMVRVCMCPTNSLGNNWQVDMVMCIISKEGASERRHRISMDTGFQDLCIAFQLQLQLSYLHLPKLGGMVLGGKMSISFS